jgi:hypothetical protein
MSPFQCNALLFFTDEASVNTKRRGDKLRSLLAANAIALGQSLADCGLGLRLFTNQPQQLAEMLEAYELPDALTIEQIGSDARIPREIPFYAAHHKLFLFERFAAERNANCLLDLDMIANREQISQLMQLQVRDVDFSRQGSEETHVEMPHAWVYDISHQVFSAYGRNTVLTDLAKLHGLSHYSRWFGGEFLLGGPEFFAYIAEACLRLLPQYLAVAGGMHHQGDEVILSAVLNRAFEGFHIADAGAAGIIARHWTNLPKHYQLPIASLRRVLLWHVPDAKQSLASYAAHRDVRRLYRNLRRVETAKRILRPLRNAWRRQ